MVLGDGQGVWDIGLTVSGGVDLCAESRGWVGGEAAISSDVACELSPRSCPCLTPSFPSPSIDFRTPLQPSRTGTPRLRR